LHFHGQFVTGARYFFLLPNVHTKHNNQPATYSVITRCSSPAQSNGFKPTFNIHLVSMSR